MRYFVFVLTAIFLLTSCSEPEIYKKGRKWTFSVESSTSNSIDTLTLKAENKLYLIKYRWDFKDYHPNGKIKTESSINFEKAKLFRDDDILEIKAPAVYDKLSEAKYIPNPQIEMPPDLNFSKEIEFKIPSVKQISHTYASDDSAKADPEVTEKMTDPVTVRGKIEAAGKILYENKAVNDSCIVLKTYGKSRKGRFNATFYFHEQYGFVYFYYDLGDKTVEIDLIDKEF